MVPGSNLLNRALRLIGSTTVQWTAYTGTSTNSVGFKVPTFAAAIPVIGSFQPVPRHLFQDLGLDFSKNYVTFYTTNAVNVVQRDQTGDRFSFNSQTFQVLSNTDWHAVDGWTNPIAVQIA